MSKPRAKYEVGSVQELNYRVPPFVIDDKVRILEVSPPSYSRSARRWYPARYKVETTTRGIFSQVIGWIDEEYLA